MRPHLIIYTLNTNQAKKKKKEQEWNGIICCEHIKDQSVVFIKAFPQQEFTAWQQP